jgi:uncharacterized repeat protein (TIGR03803 family)
LYGTAGEGGVFGNGTLFSINIDGSDFTNLHSFTANPAPDYTNNDGGHPTGSVLSGNTLYGTVEAGGAGGRGAVFKINTDGSCFTNLHSFAPLTDPFELTNADGVQPFGGMIISGNSLYGTAQYGGIWGCGTVFRLNTDGSGFTNLYNFSPYTNHNSQGIATNGDGAVPLSGVIVCGNTLYGTTGDGGTGGHGTVFRLNTDGSGFTNLHSFVNSSDVQGAGPSAPLVMSGNTLFGTGPDESGDAGAVFRLNTDGSDFAYIYTFTGGSDGKDALDLTLSGNVLYGGATGANTGGSTIFRLNTDGSGFTVLFSFPPGYPENADGAVPAGIVVSQNVIYGDTQGGGPSGTGVIYSLTLPVPSLAITSLGNQFVVSWPAWATNSTLQTTTGLPFVSWNTITNGITGDGTNFYFVTPSIGQTAFFRLNPIQP